MAALLRTPHPSPLTMHGCAPPIPPHSQCSKCRSVASRALIRLLCSKSIPSPAVIPAIMRHFPQLSPAVTPFVPSFTFKPIHWQNGQIRSIVGRVGGAGNIIGLEITYGTTSAGARGDTTGGSLHT